MNDAQREYEERRRLERERAAIRKTRRVRWNRRRANRALPMPPEVYEAKVAGRPCRTCTGSRARVEAHHLVERKHFAADDPVVHDPDNVIALCADCHHQHHTAMRRVPREALTAVEYGFVVARRGESWASRWYPETIERTA